MPKPEQSVKNFMRKRWIPNEEALASWVLQIGEDLAAEDSGLSKKTLSALLQQHFPAGADSCCAPENFGLGCVVDQKDAGLLQTAATVVEESLSVDELRIADDARLPLEHQIDLPRVDESTTQGNIGSCVSWAGAHTMESAINNTDGRCNERINPSAIYGFIKGKRLDPWPEEHGSNLKALATALYRYGAPSWDSMPVYRSAPEDNPANLPHSSGVAEKASKNRIQTPAWIAEWDDSTIYQAMCLMKGEYKAYPTRELVICTAFRVPASFFNAYTAKTGIVMMPPSNDRILGGHAVVLIGWKQINSHRYFIVKNSWGTSFGDGGYLYVPEMFIKHYFKRSFVIPALQREQIEQQAIATNTTHTATRIVAPLILCLLAAIGGLALIQPDGIGGLRANRPLNENYTVPETTSETREAQNSSSIADSRQPEHKSEPLDEDTHRIYAQILHMLKEVR